MHEQHWVDAVARAYHSTEMDGLMALVLLRDWVSQQIDIELDLRNEQDGSDHE